LPAAQIADAQLKAFEAYGDMMETARRLLVVMPTEPKAPVDLLLYLEKNFSVSPPERLRRQQWTIIGVRSSAHSAAVSSSDFEVWQTRADVMKRRRRSHGSVTGNGLRLMPAD
jgi:hypothetical protein